MAYLGLFHRSSIADPLAPATRSDDLVTWAIGARLGPLLYRRCAPVPTDESHTQPVGTGTVLTPVCPVTGAGLQRLRQCYVQALCWTAAQEAALAELAGRCHAAGLEAVVLKGVPLGRLLYGEPALRPADDIDLWVRPDEAEAVEHLLDEAGYRTASGPSGVLPPSGRARLLERRFDGVARGVTLAIDLHVALSDSPFSLPGEAFGRRSRPMTDGTRTISGLRVLAPSDLLLHLAVHATGHGLAGAARNLVDLAHLAARLAPADWHEVSVAVAGAPAAGCVLLPLGLAHDLLGAPVPAGLLRGFRQSRRWCFLCAVARRSVERDAWLPGRLLECLCLSSPVEQHIFLRRLLREGRRQRIPHLWGAARRSIDSARSYVDGRR